MYAPFVAAVAGLGLVGCASLNPVYTDSGGTPSGNYDRDRIAAVVSRGSMPVEILGNPTDLSAGDFGSIVIQRLRLPPIWGPHRFAIDPDQKPDHGYRIVLAFNPALEASESPATQPDATPDSTERHAITLCNNTMEMHIEGPYPPLPIKRLERLRGSTDRVWPRYFAERLLVRGALCLGDVPITYGFVERNALDDHDDPEFDQVLSLLLLRLMPYRTSPSG
jgi:hypothetical protein